MIIDQPEIRSRVYTQKNFENHVLPKWDDFCYMHCTRTWSLEKAFQSFAMQRFEVSKTCATCRRTQCQNNIFIKNTHYDDNYRKFLIWTNVCRLSILFVHEGSADDWCFRFVELAFRCCGGWRVMVCDIICCKRPRSCLSETIWPPSSTGCL